MTKTEYKKNGQIKAAEAEITLNLKLDITQTSKTLAPSIPTMQLNCIFQCQ